MDSGPRLKLGLVEGLPSIAGKVQLLLGEDPDLETYMFEP